MRENLVLNKRVGIWIRVSTEDQAKGDSPEIHEARARAYATAKGWDAVEIYDLAGLKGWSGSPGCATRIRSGRTRRGRTSSSSRAGPPRRRRGA